jgi:hypothetical protein
VGIVVIRYAVLEKLVGVSAIVLLQQLQLVLAREEYAVRRVRDVLDGLIQLELVIAQVSVAVMELVHQVRLPVVIHHLTQTTLLVLMLVVIGAFHQTAVLQIIVPVPAELLALLPHLTARRVIVQVMVGTGVLLQILA